MARGYGYGCNCAGCNTKPLQSSKDDNNWKSWRKKIPVLIVGNKIDMRKADTKRIEMAFPEYDVTAISAKSEKTSKNFTSQYLNYQKKFNIRNG